MKRINTILVTLFLTISASAFSSQVVPNYPDTVCEQGICASLSKSKKGKVQLNVNFPENLLDGYIRMGIVSQDVTVQMVDPELNRSGIGFYADITNLPNGDFSIYFVNNQGRYYSDYSANFHFLLYK